LNENKKKVLIVVYYKKASIQLIEERLSYKLKGFIDFQGLQIASCELFSNFDLLILEPWRYLRPS